MLTFQRYLFSLIITILILSGCEQSEKPQTQINATDNKKIEELRDETERNSTEICQLTMGWEPWEPYHYEDLEKKVKGLDIELMELIKVETGCEISYQKGDWKSLLTDLKLGKIDFLTGASITEKRKVYASFSDGYRTESFRLYVRVGESKLFPGFNMKKLIDDGFRLGITMDYIYNDEVNGLQDESSYVGNIFPVSTGLINIAKLLEDEIDGFLEDPVVGSSSIRRQGLENQIELHPYEINTGDVHVMFSKVSVNESIIMNFNQALSKIRMDGRHDRLMDKYTN